MGGNDAAGELHRLLSEHCHPQQRAKALTLLEKVAAEARQGGEGQSGGWAGGGGGDGFAGNDGWGAVSAGMGPWGAGSFAGGGEMGGVPMWVGGFGGGGGWFGGAGGAGAAAGVDEATVLNMALDGPGLRSVFKIVPTSPCTCA